MKILIIRLSSLGDIVLTEPVVNNLKKHYPQAEIFYLVKPVFREVVSAFPEEIRIIEWYNDLRSLLHLSSYRFDLVIDLHNKLNTALIRAFCRSRKKIVYDKQHTLRRKIVARKTDKVISSTVDLYFTVFKALNIVPEFRYPRLMADSAVKPIEQRDYLVIIPGATSFTKRWLAGNFAKLTDMLASNFQILIGGNASEVELCREIEESCQAEVINLCGKTSISELTAVISRAKCVIANDSGPAHLTAALNIPLIAIFGGTSPKLGFAPLGNKVSIITKDLDCSPCSLHGLDACPKGHFDCMKQISVDEVYNLLMRLVKPKI